MSDPPPEQGFAAWPGVFRPSEMTRLAKLLDDDCEQPRAGKRGLMADPVIRALAADPRATALAGTVLRASARPFRATLFNKSPKSNWLVAWHQDTALPVRRRRETAGWTGWSVKAGVVHAHAPAAVLEGIVALRIHLDDSRDDNGPLRVLPGTHLLGVLTGSAINDLARRVSPVECALAAGDVLTMRPLLVHASSKARSPAPRRILHVEYATSLQIGPGLELALA